MFILLPVGMDYRARRYPVVTFTIMGICTALYLVDLACKLGGDAQAVWDWDFEHLWLIPSESHWWTYITSMFVHQGFFHLFGNMIYLFLFGACVEDMIGRLHFSIFYLVCGIGSSLAYIMFSPQHFASDIPEGGASGAISACIGGYLLLRAKAHIQFKWIVIFFFRFFQGDFTMPAWIAISFWFLKDFGMMLLSAALDAHGGGVAFGAHVGGTLLGAGFIALEKIRLKKMPQEIEEEEVAIKPVQIVRKAPAAWAAPRPGQTRTISLHPAASEPPTPAPAAVPATSEPPTIHLSWDGAQSGPFTLSQVQQMFAAGEIPTTAYYWQEGMSDWRSAEELREPGVG
ncbi:MAG TPA: rhomboid family intramembrane serine protease [Verrucomicrobiae bacterium]|jgi:membrane associated rhomboid family serine protease|nr:rhomboid family intramembrane serine protease [Verrucomicrobiae bacterium]